VQKRAAQPVAAIDPARVAGDSWPLVGRERLVRRIITGYEETGGPHSGGVVLIGAAGVGKTRLARETAIGLASRAGPIHWTTASDSAAAVPLGALVPLLAAADFQRGPDSADHLDVFGALLARFRTTGPRPVLVVDDAHLLDGASAGLLFQLASERRAYLLLTVRAGEPAPDAVTSLWASEIAGRLEVPALREEDVAALLANALEGRLDPVSAGEIRRICAGNPLLLRELLRAGLETGTLRRNGVWRWTGESYVTGRLTDVVRDRLGALEPTLVAVGELLACGEPVPVSMLEQLTSHAAVVEAERRALVVVETSGRRLLARLAHPIYADVIRAGIPHSRRREVWRQLAGALAATPMRRRDDVLLAARWRQLGGLPTAPDLLLTAADHAHRRLDLDLAEQLARVAMAEGGADPAGLLLAELLIDRGRYQEAGRVLPADPDPELRSRWLVARDRIRYWGTNEPTDHAPAADSDPSAEAARSWLLIGDGHNHAALRVALRVIREPDPPPAAANWAGAAAVAAAGLLGGAAEASGLLAPALAAADRHRDRHRWGWHQVAATGCVALLATGRLGEARQLADQAYRDAVGVADRFGTGATPIIGTAAVMRGLIDKAQGRARAALAWLTEAAALLEAWPTYRLERLYLAELAATRALLGDLTGAAERLEQADRHADSPVRLLDAWVERARAWVTAAGGDTRRAAGLALHAAGLAEATEQPTIQALALFDACRFAVAGTGPSTRLGEPEGATRRLAVLAGRLELPAIATLATTATALAAADAGPELDRAAQALAGHGYLLYAAEAAQVAYRRHIAAGRSARANLSLVRATELAQDCDGARTPLLASDGLATVLTARERQVAALAAAGHSGPKIAAQLGLSVRTVNNYLGRAYHKLGIGSRGELAAILRTRHP
jgi:DNA-binding CsgD family transcriptional regulator